MAKYSQQLQDIFKRYQEEVSAEPVELSIVGAWAIGKGLWKPRPKEINEIFASEMADALREETRIDKKGRKHRSKLPVKIKTSTGQFTLWADIDTAPRNHVERNLAMRRKSVVSDLYSMRQDAAHYKDYHPNEEPIQQIFNFEDDMAELDVMDDKEAA